MIRYNYLLQIHPPAPFIYVTIRNPVNGSEMRDVPAQLDSAGDRTVVPDSIAKNLSLPQIGAVKIGGVGGLTQSMPSYPAEITIHNFTTHVIEVVASPGESWILLGRDVLNVYRILLDGPQLALEIG